MYIKLLMATALAGIALVGCDNVDKKVPPGAQYESDNTGKNIRDRNRSTYTPGDQSESDADLIITKKIRQAVIEDNTLSGNAKNVKIITAEGVVVLRGPVNSAEEKNKVGSIAAKVEGVKKVNNQLETAPAK